MYPYGLIGNCQLSALVSTHGSIDWLCLPRPDSEPLFGALLDRPQGGHFTLAFTHGETRPLRQEYLENTNILVTELENPNGERLRITDFCPRYEKEGSTHRPLEVIRILEPLVGAPEIKIALQPIHGWRKTSLSLFSKAEQGAYEIQSQFLYIKSQIPIDVIQKQSAFTLKEKVILVLRWDQPLSEDVTPYGERCFRLTEQYWRTWVKHCSIPTLYQKETIRSALTLKLHCYEETGAILAALTTSLPEEVGETRNWDYRYCWLRDAYFVLQAFHHLGHFEEMEGFLRFILKILQTHEDSEERLAPVYRLDQTLPLPEVSFEHWEGYQGSRPVRAMNQAAEHIQNDIYGELLLALAPIYLDERFVHLRTPEHEHLFIQLALLCERAISKPDAGLWEIRNGWQEHTFSNLMSWAGLERLARIQARGHLKGIPFDVLAARKRALDSVFKSERSQSLRNGPEDPTLDAALGLCATLGFPDPEINRATVQQIIEHLQVGSDRPMSSYLFRYLRNDDFGKPKSAFLVCSFWVAQALARLGLKKEAQEILEDTLQAQNHLGLFSEHFDISNRKQLGNFPQAYSHVGLILAAFAISPSWDDVL